MTEQLEFHHLKGRDWPLTKKSRWQRLAIVAREIELGLIAVLCRSCNARIGKPAAKVDNSLLDW